MIEVMCAGFFIKSVFIVQVHDRAAWSDCSSITMIYASVILNFRLHPCSIFSTLRCSWRALSQAKNNQKRYAENAWS